MSNDRRNHVRRLSRDNAAAEALGVARNFIAETPSGEYDLAVTRATPNRFDPQPVGKTPSQWIVGTDYVIPDSSDVVIDGAPMIIVDLLTQTACWGFAE